jgi:hypothetical protein
MKEYPPIPDVADAPPDLLDSGHLWIQERIAGLHLRFRMNDSGLLAFGDRTRVFDRGNVPLPYRHAVRHVREAFDRDALRQAADDPSALVFFGEATVHRTLDYDWSRTPPFLGFDVWSGEREAFLPPDRVERAFDRLGLHTVNAVEKEVPARDFHADRYDLPASRWRDGPVAGVVVRNKNGARATIDNPAVSGRENAPGSGSPSPDTDSDPSPEALADGFVTGERVAEVVERLEDRGDAVAFEAVYERVLEELAREECRRLFDADGEPRVDVGALQDAVAARTREQLSD